MLLVFIFALAARFVALDADVGLVVVTAVADRARRSTIASIAINSVYQDEVFVFGPKVGPAALAEGAVGGETRAARRVTF